MKRAIGEALKSGLIGGVLSGTISGLLNYFVIPFPDGPFKNVMGHGIGGFLAGLFSAFVGVVIYARLHGERKGA